MGSDRIFLNNEAEKKRGRMGGFLPSVRGEEGPSLFFFIYHAQKKENTACVIGVRKRRGGGPEEQKEGQGKKSGNSFPPSYSARVVEKGTP